MIPMRIASPTIFGIPQDRSPGTGMFPVMTDFLLLFEQAIADSLPAPGANETAYGDPAGGRDAPEGEALLDARRSATGDNGEKGSAGPQASPAEALFAVLLCPPSQNPLPELPDRPDDVADHSLFNVNVAPVVGPSHTTMTPSGIAQAVAVTSEPSGIRTLRIPDLEIANPADAPGSSTLSQDRRMTTPWVDVETYTANADGVPVGIEVINKEDPRAALVIAGNQREDGTLSIESPLAPLLKKGVGGMSVAALARDGGGAGDVRSEESRSIRRAAPATTSAQEIQDRIGRAGNGQVTAQAADPLRTTVSAFPGGRDVVVIDRPGVRFDVDRVADVTPRLSVVELTRAPQIRQEDSSSGLVSDRQTLASPIAAVGVAITGEPTIVADVADVANGRFQLVTLSGDVVTHAGPDAPVERTISGTASGPQSIAWDTTPSADRDPHYEERVGGAPRTTTPDEAAVGTPLGRSVETVEQTSRSVRSAAVIATSTEPMADSDSELYGGDELSRGIRSEHAGGDRIVVPHSAKRDETPQDPQQDRWSPGTKDGGPRPDGSVSSSVHGRQFGLDLAGATASKGEHLRPNVSDLSPRPRLVVEQVAEQIGTAAGISRRQDGESVQLRLHPQTLGELVVEVSWGESGIVAAIKTQSHVTGELLAADLGRLRIALEKQGFSVSDLGVQVGLDFRQWNSAGNGFHTWPGIEHPAETIPRHDRRFALPAVAAIGPNSLIDIMV